MAKLINDLANSELYKQEPPRFGREVREQCFAFTPGYINLNNGVHLKRLRCQFQTLSEVLNERIEANPDLFHRLDYQQILVDVRNEVAEFIGANVDEVVLVPNATTGVNTVLRNFTWQKGDTLVSCEYSGLD
ncbi:hypothetical protein C0995_011192 [Termitomyces sp. Mi166|nr:hypothetical protein C0995_011192 [Termitomyces sp. Mi166\